MAEKTRAQLLSFPCGVRRPAHHENSQDTNKRSAVDFGSSKKLVFNFFMCPVSERFFDSKFRMLLSIWTRRTWHSVTVGSTNANGKGGEF